METPVVFLLENLKQVVVYHAHLISGAKGELEQLQKDLDLLKAKLKDASTRQKDEEVFKVWTKQIRDVVYQVEDTIDACITNNMSKSIISANRMSLAKEVRALREGVVREMFNQEKIHFANLSTAEPIRESVVETTDQWRKELGKGHIVGLEDEAEKVINLLKQESKGLDVISIIGMPGLGKTTLAWKIFQDPIMQYEFPVRIWITVSAELNSKNVFLSILESFTQQRDKYSKSSAEELAKVVKEKLENGKFVIIMDDVWTPDAWEEIKKGLPLNNGMCKVLITTRHSNVASHANATRDPHELRFLDKYESWELLQYEVYGYKLKADDDHAELQNIGMVIAKQCDGLPLSIIVIAGILKDKIATSKGSISLIRDEWKKISHSVPSYLTHEDKLGRMSKIIALSYTKLPFDLRDCFFYLGMFPEDAETSARELIHLWIAEGFIQEKPHKSLEEIALDNLKDLISRNLVMVEKTKANGEVKTFRVHDTIREFCKKQAAEQNLFQEIKKGEKISENVTKCRRLCVHSHVHDLFSQKLKIPSARSFLCFPKEPVNLEAKDVAAVTSAFSLLRVFDAEKIKFPKFPPKLITPLIHLRYLTLSLAIELKILPEAITELYNLQTLIVDTISRTLEIKADLWKMSQLRHLRTKAAISLTAKCGKGQRGDNLRTLDSLLPESCTDIVFTKAKNLHTLGIRGNLSKLLETNSLEKLEELNKLKLEHDTYPHVTAENPLRSLPQHHRFPQKLKILSLKSTYLKWQQMSSIMGKLEALEVLKLKDHAFSEENKSWKVTEGGFVNLEFLHIERTDLTFWAVSSENCFPKLRSLKIKNCEELNGIPKELGKNLEMLSLERVTKYAVISAMDIEMEKKNKGTARRFKLAIAPADTIFHYQRMQ